MEEKSTEWPEIVMDIYTGFQKSQVLFVTTELQLYDLLENSASGMTAHEIASKKNINLDALEIILDYAAGLKLIRKNPDSVQATYSNIPEIADVLQADKPNNMVAAIMHASRIHYPLYQHLMTTVKDGNNRQAYKNAFGSEVTDDTYSIYNIDEELSANFLKYMHEISSTTAPRVAKSFDLSTFSTICDLGGGSGALAYALASEYPDVTVTVFDLATAVTAAHNIRPDKGDRYGVEFVVGDFFKDDFPQASLYTFSRIIHNWEENKIHELLDKTFHSLKSGGAVLIAETLLNETKTGPLHALSRNVKMLLLMMGKERTEREYRQLLEQHGFVDFRCKSVKDCNRPVHVMLAYKP